MLDAESLSFHIGTGNRPKQLPKGCVINGYTGKKCGGSFVLQINGPSSDTTCYTTASKSQTVQSVIERC